MRSLGVDVGGHSLKAVLLESGWTGARVVTAVEVPLDERPLQQALTDLLVRLGETPDAFGVGLDRGAALARTVQLPFSDPAKVAQAAPFAAEELLPMGLDRVRVAHLPPRGRGPGGKYDVPILAVPIQQLEGRRALRLEELEPYLQLDSVAAVEALYESPQAPTEDGAVLLVDVGGRKTNLEVVDTTGPVTTRSLRIGTSRMAAAAAPHLAGSERDLEGSFTRAFLEHGNPGAEAMRAVMAVYDDLAREARQTVTTTQGQGLRVARVVVTGGGARLKHLARYLGEKLGLPAAVLELKGLSGKAEAPERFSVAYGLSLVASDRGRVPLDFQPERRKATWDDPFVVGILSLGLLLSGVVLAGKLWWRATSLEEQIATQRAKVTAVLERSGVVADGRTGRFPPLAERIERTRKLLSAFQSSGRSPLAVLDAVSEAVPVQGNLQFDLVRLDRSDLRIEAKADSFVPAEDFEANLRANPALLEVKLENQVSGYRTGGGQGSQFVVTARIREEAFR